MVLTGDEDGCGDEESRLIHVHRETNSLLVQFLFRWIIAIIPIQTLGTPKGNRILNHIRLLGGGGGELISDF